MSSTHSAVPMEEAQELLVEVPEARFCASTMKYLSEFFFRWQKLEFLAYKAVEKPTILATV